MIYGYARVSTAGQARDGNSLTDQEKKLREAGATIIYSDSFTGTTTDRPEMDKLKAVVQPGDKIIVTKLDRLARSASKGTMLVKEWLDNGIAVHILNMGEINRTPTGKLIMQIMFAFAEFERDLIVERTQEGKAIAKLDPNFREGRPKKYTKAQMDHAMELLEDRTYRQVTEMTGISKATLVRERRKRREEEVTG